MGLGTLVLGDGDGGGCFSSLNQASGWDIYLNCGVYGRIIRVHI